MARLALASLVAALPLGCGAPSGPPAPPVVSIEPEAAAPSPPAAPCEVVAVIAGPDQTPVKARRTADDCRSAYEAFEVADGSTIWALSVAGLAGRDPQLVEHWDVPATDGTATCAIVLGIATGRAEGRAEGDKTDEVVARAKQDACAQLGLGDGDCRARARVQRTTTQVQVIAGEMHAQATVETVVYDEAEGEGRGATKLDACRAAIAKVCRPGRCRDTELLVERIDDVPVLAPADWPRADLFGRSVPR